MSKRALLKALLAGGLTTLATAALTVAASAPQAPLMAINVLHIAPLDHHALPLTALPPGQRVIVVNDTHRPLQVKGFARGGSA
ncbi:MULTISPECIES: hypothetical protein [unclassified Thiomonas]|uniref:hypothetical protein n=1 Tax=unclassified Thiomonas TaxID=2625466 RepID=UPI0004DBB038|nr:MULTISPECIES: hypothetical protein [unclassified Thiomonas]MDE2174958.1 hypothetical protein [Betaproteobacteria bacterium]CDW94941.1 conserved exported hypothetical protein [Thiomonas sp. CB2]VDY03981.1 conserved exported protein of unknown function [Thiomonas sp. Bio17B3]VDY08848.1 conserved exported protein of unknown function [Thiomonas sp. Sup16B3]VDY12228.1 hypothetical protein; putative exported protein [Thiomonas sp. OC7]